MTIHVDAIITIHVENFQVTLICMQIKSIRDGPNMFANDDFSDLYANYNISYTSETESNEWFPRSNYHVT